MTDAAQVVKVFGEAYTSQPNQWGGIDVTGASKALRLTVDDGGLNAIVFTDWRSQVVEYEIDFGYAPGEVVVAALNAVLR